ncbi:MAG TPA: hydrogenase nickel incorporation protein HypB [Bacillota bacterium]|nr:hydrogenase nickel incorporation protein HypB [Bacillota bacterium]
MQVKVMENIMSSNEKLAAENRTYFEQHQICAVNVMASPGSGKTSVIVKLIESLAVRIPFCVVEGDIASSIDAEKIEALGIPVLQINTGGGCHLDANMIKTAVAELQPVANSVLFIENVGNLVCPSAFDLGESLRLVIASVPEGHDKPYKYVSMFESADVIILNKVDLMPYIDFNRDSFLQGIRALNSKAPVFEVSCRTGSGIAELTEWLSNLVKG